MNIEDETKDIKYGNFAIYLDGKPVAYGIKHDEKYSLDIPYTDSKLFQSNANATEFIDTLLKDQLLTSGGSTTFTVNHSNGSIKQVIINGYKRIKSL